MPAGQVVYVLKVTGAYFTTPGDIANIFLLVAKITFHHKV